MRTKEQIIKRLVNTYPGLIVEDLNQDHPAYSCITCIELECKNFKLSLGCENHVGADLDTYLKRVLMEAL